ncbi:MAG TPA: dTDP-4-dehydrorhamnose reductase [Prolixibacteraceae bacterium]|nr:dTDP-4-dehydrorhamnose reductase [Prolixibacteraceae bacterium]
MRILVTGSKGQLGNEIHVLAEDYPDFDFIYADVDELDITDQLKVEAFFVVNKPQVIINCAAYTAVDKAESDEVTSYLINATAVENLAKSAAMIGALIVQISTDYVFDGKSYLPYSEMDETNPQSAYGRTKLAGENAVFKFASKGLILRTSWLYSAFGNNFVKTMTKYGIEREELNVVYDQVGTPTYARDLAKAILDIIPSAIQHSGTELFHYSNEGVASWYDFAKIVMSFSGINCNIKPIRTKDYPLPAPRPAFSVLSKSKIKDIYKIKIPYWSDSVKECIQRLG